MKILLLSIFIFNSFAFAEHAMQFYAKPFGEESIITKKYLHKGQRVIYANGVIESGTVEKFKEYVHRNNIKKGFVFLKSEGGSLLEGIALGKAIRSLGFDTTIGYLDNYRNSQYSGMCASACAYTFAGGVARYIYNNNQKLGVHQFYNGKGSGNLEDIGVVQNISAIVADHLLKMGISQKAFVLASSVGSNDMKWLTKNEALSLNFANNGKNITTAEIKIMNTNNGDQKPYLLVEQVHSEGIGKLIFSCQKNSIKLLSGIITTRDKSVYHYKTLEKSYFELDKENILTLYKKDGANAAQEALWLERTLDRKAVNKILHSNIMNIWTENNSYIRWGIEIDLYPIKKQLKEYIDTCKARQYTPINTDETISFF